MTRFAVVGGTGRVGREVVDVSTAAGQEPVVVARSRGIDLMDGGGLVDALAGVDSVIDVTNTTVADPAEAREFFTTTTRNLFAAERRAGVKHHVVLSIVGIDRVEGNAHFAGKRRQEELVRSGGIPATITRATMFHDFAEMVVGWAPDGDPAIVAPLLVQPVAVSDVAAVLVELASERPKGSGTRLVEVAGPELQDLVDMARRTLVARGEPARITPGWHGPLGVEMAGEILLPGPVARIGPTTFDSWLTEQS